MLRSLVGSEMCIRDRLKTSLGGANFESIKSNTEKVATLSQALGSAMYAAAGEGAAAEDGVEDAEVVEEGKA